jgi:outer membrane biosynthesis protein TonB
VQHQLASRRSAVDACIAEDPSASGRVVYRLVVGVSGKVEAVQLIEAEHRYPAIERCLSRSLSSWHFSPPPARTAEGRVAIELD